MALFFLDFHLRRGLSAIVSGQGSEELSSFRWIGTLTALASPIAKGPGIKMPSKHLLAHLSQLVCCLVEPRSSPV